MPEKYQKIYKPRFLFDVCITNAYILSSRISSNQPVSQSLKNLKDEVCNTAYWIYKSQKHTGKTSRPATELLPPTLPHLDHLPATGDISRRCVHCQKQTNMNPLNGEVAYGCAMPVLRSHICS